MGRIKLKEENKKGKISITISKSLLLKLEEIPNKSFYIENLISNDLNNHNTKNKN